ncbi:MAG: ATP-binding cassette domain-containing protein [Brevundimonas sp.]|uniref:amino acid ABC transporter ATP-binding/permease protein n=1 Tax=Brevundimonas sp. TaxID=1871086 RepID=UPI0025678BF4|nr:ATP-binding cassette domain-containing protein [Brevundimonas sp.]MDK2748840.1 ATP-binding cassette domain-containing protein [Brevundimonas sp.]
MTKTPSSRIGELIAAQRQAQRGRLRIAAAGGAVVAVAATCLLGLSGWFITGAAIAGVAGSAAVQAFNYMMPSATIRLLAILRTGARYIERVAGHEAALKALARLRPQLFDALASAPPAQALALSSGEASARLVQDVDAVQTLFVRLSAPWALGAGAVSAAFLAGMASPLAGLMLLLAMGLSAAGSVLIARRLAAPAGREVQIATGRLKDRLASLEAVSPELKAYGLDRWAASEAAHTASGLDRAQIALSQAGGWMAAWQATVTGLAVAAVVPATLGASLPMTALAALAAVMGIEAAAGLVGALQQNGAAVEAARRLDALASAPSLASSPAPSEASLVLSADGVQMAPPMRLGLIGPSGSGKTTLAERLVGLRDALAHEARLGGLDIAGVAPDDRRPLFAYAAQDIRLIDGTIRDNLLLAGPAEDGALWRALEDAALAERVRADPAGLDARVGPNGERLSGGERRRLGLARAYLRSAPWLVLDEPTEGLDPTTEARVLTALDRRLKHSGQGLIVVSHRPAPTQLCDRVIRVEGIAEDGKVRLTVTRQLAPV